MLKNDGYLIKPGIVTKIIVLGKNKRELCEVEIVDQIFEGSSVRLQVKTYWKRRDEQKSFMRLFNNLLYEIDGKAFKVISSTANATDETPFNTILEYIGESGEDECSKTFYDDKCIIGCGVYNSIENNDIFTDWKYIIDSVYGEGKYDYTLYPEWHSFQNFAEWYSENKPKEKSKFGKYILVKDIERHNCGELGPLNTVFIEKSIMKFPKYYEYVLSNPDVYTVTKNYSSNNQGNEFKSYVYNYETNKLELLGTFRSQEEARSEFLDNLMTRRTEILKTLKQRNKTGKLSELIRRIESL